MHCEAERAKECKEVVEQAFIQAGHMVMGLPEFPLRVHADITYCPNHYKDIRVTLQVKNQPGMVGQVLSQRSLLQGVHRDHRKRPEFLSITHNCALNPREY